MFKVLNAKIRDSGAHGPESYEYINKKVNIGNFKDLCLFFFVLESYGANIEKAYREFKSQKKNKKWPFQNV